MLKGLVDPKQSAPIIAAAKESSVESALAESYGAVDQGGPRPILVARKARERVAIRDVHDTDSVNMLWLLLPNDGYPS
ncbi:MAG TPA: hypothetical protein VH054_14250 [Polyangiaceae bacterium]|nr:hypothetical protein [Polyangiaceae bacterium]